MKMHLESGLPYQIEVIESVGDLFCGRAVCRSAFPVTGQAPVGHPPSLRAYGG
ncbi:hypothetical protein [Curvibacter gracilis]|uniref:hypothetical protein n=1 Tax=Curvibacter gracilis TaxID=230310 RepID=UPI0004B1F30B|nr:hypothetical protein [Curvibacter gracilis]